MVRYYCKSILLGVIFGVIIYVEARPADNNARTVQVPNKSDSVQMLQFNVLDSAAAAVSSGEREESFSKKLFDNLTDDVDGRQKMAVASPVSSGLHIPVHVIYDAPVLKYASKSGDTTVKLVNRLSSSSATSPHTRNSKQRNFPVNDNDNDDEEDADVVGGVINVIENDLEKRPRRSSDSNSASASASPDGIRPAISLILPQLHASGQDDGGNDKVSTTVPAVSGNGDDRNNNGTTTSRIQEEYILPILARLRQVSSVCNGAFSVLAPMPIPMPSNALQSPYWYDATRFPYGVAPPPSPPLQPYNLHHVHDSLLYDYYTKQWSSPFADYFPIVIRDPFQSALNYFSDLLEYGPAADVCQLRQNRGRRDIGNHEIAYRTARSFNRRQKRNARKKENRGKHHYVNEADAKRKDLPSSTTTTTTTTTTTASTVLDAKKRKAVATFAQAKQHGTGVLGGGGETASNVRGTDVGPQISKLIVRRGGVAIAGAGGIATAGSGGTAIVGPGGTAFTTPASSGGVAMVGPGGKVVKVPDLTNVLYGRTSANIAATGAGHATFTTKDGQVFTTSDNTGGVALVNPDGGLLGVSDDENLRLHLLSLQQQQQQQPQQQQHHQQDDEAKVKQTNEVQLPAGARLLTTGPIIYYNPVYPAVTAPLR